MKQADLTDLRNRIAGLAKESAVGGRFQNVVVEPNYDEDGGDFLRVVIKLKDLSAVEAQDVEPLIKSIEEAVAEIDERFPSVRFDEAA
jgi:hypothetical protein